MHDVEVEAHKESSQRRKKPLAPKVGSGSGGGPEPPSASSLSSVVDPNAGASSASDPQPAPVIVVVDDVDVAAPASASEPLTNGPEPAATLTNGASTTGKSTGTSPPEDPVKNVTEDGNTQSQASQAVEVGLPEPKLTPSAEIASEPPASHEVVTTTGDEANGEGKAVANSVPDPASALGVASSELPKPDVADAKAEPVVQAPGAPSSDGVTPVSNGAAAVDPQQTSSASQVVPEATEVQVPGGVPIAVPAAVAANTTTEQPEGPSGILSVPVVRSSFSLSAVSSHKQLTVIFIM